MMGGRVCSEVLFQALASVLPRKSRGIVGRSVPASVLWTTATGIRLEPIPPANVLLTAGQISACDCLSCEAGKVKSVTEDIPSGLRGAEQGCVARTLRSGSCWGGGEVVTGGIRPRPVKGLSP
eukprot:1547646-Rhodomonas_salina.3